MTYSLATTSIDNPVSNAGLQLDSHKDISTQQPIRILAPPAELVLPLDQHAGAPAVPIVNVGDIVAKGQPIAKPGATLSAWLHSPVSGTVSAIELRATAHHEGASALSIVIDNDGAETLYADNVPLGNYESLAPEALCEHIARGGIVGLGGAVFPTAVKLTRDDPERTFNLILNGAECEPYISCDDMLMRERARDIVLGAEIMLYAVQAQRCVIAIEGDKPQAEAAMRAALTEAADPRLELAILGTEYPAGGERQLIAAIDQREVPSGGLPQDVGVICQNVGTAAAVTRWIVNGEPLISRIVTVTGDGVQQPGNVEVRFGTPINKLISECGGYTDAAQCLIMGGSMMGLAMPRDDLPVVKGTNCILVASAAELQPRAHEMPCIRCGECAQACPVALLPMELHFHTCSGDFDPLARLGLLDCIECGCCDYVCPSQIPLTQRFRQIKPALIEHLDRRLRAQHYRERFETRNARIATLESDRRAKLEAKRMKKE
ncbi:MAG: electron transport complex subunit RsxC [Steroidobacteraceae bacterium]